MKVMQLEAVVDEIEKIEVAIEAAESVEQIKELLRQLCKVTATLAYYTPDPSY